jgi:hypothetical protein
MDKKFICKTCNRYYKSYQSLWNHNKKFHSINNHNITNHNHTDNQNITINNHNKYNCKYCNKQFNFNQNKWRHEKKCNKTLIKKYNDLKEENELLKEEFKKEIDNLKNQMLELMNKNCKMHPKTLQKINKQMNNQLNNCNITNNINIVQLGNENILETLSQKEKLKILSHCYGSFDKLIECIHFNPKYPQFKNIAITNLKDDYAYKYDEKQNKFIACKKEELLEDLLDNRVIDLEEILDENIEKINNVKISKIKDLIDKLYDKELLYNTKKSDIKLLIYNKCDKKKS